MENTYDITIIGGGPSGIFASYYAGLRNLKVAIIETLPVLGGQVSALYPKKNILDVAGYYSVEGQNLINDLIKQTKRFDVDVFLEETVTNVSYKDNFVVETNKQKFESKSIIIATGNGSFKARELALINEKNIKNAEYFISDLSDYKDKDTLVLGGGDTAVDFSLMLNGITKTTTLVHRRDNFRALESSLIELQNSGTIIKTPYQVVDLEEVDGKINVSLNDNETLQVDKILVAYGFTSSSSIIDGWDIKPDKYNQAFASSSTQETNIPGVFVIGDASGYDGKADLIATGFGEAPTAVNSAVNFFDPDRGGPSHSTSLGIK
jgi:thioredoxin reductase (NADPH)